MVSNVLKYDKNYEDKTKQDRGVGNSGGRYRNFKLGYQRRPYIEDT